MQLTNYIIQIIVSIGIFIILCAIGEKVKKCIKRPSHINSSLKYFPYEELFTLAQVHYLIIILFIYITIINLFFKMNSTPSSEFFIINCIIDIFLSLSILLTFYDGSTKMRIISIFLVPFASIASLIFGGSLLAYWNYIRVPALLYVVVISYHKFLEFTKENALEKLILILISILFTGLVITMIFENQNSLNSLAMVSNAITSNGYTVLGDSNMGVMTSIFLVWAGYVISGVSVATLTAALIKRSSKKKIEDLEDKIDNLEKIIIQYHDENRKSENETKK